MDHERSLHPTVARLPSDGALVTRERPQRRTARGEQPKCAHVIAKHVVLKGELADHQPGGGASGAIVREMEAVAELSRL